MKKIALFFLMLVLPLQAKPVIEAIWESWECEVSLDTLASMPCDIYHILGAEVVVRDATHLELQSSGGHKERLREFIQKAHSQHKKCTILLPDAYPFYEFLQEEQSIERLHQAIVAFVKDLKLDGITFLVQEEKELAKLSALVKKIKTSLSECELTLATFFFDSTYALLEKEPTLFTTIICLPLEEISTTVEKLGSIGIKPDRVSYFFLSEEQEDYDKESLEEIAVLVQQLGIRGVTISSINEDLKMLKTHGFSVISTLSN